MSTTPLSDLMAEHADSGSPESYDRFLVLFRDSVVGIVGQTNADGRYTAGQTDYGDGRSRLLTFADPEVASQVPGSPCNAGIDGRVLLQMAVGDPNLAGLLVNCATRPISMIISRESAEAALDPA